MTDPFASALDALFNAPGSEAAEHKSIYGQITRGVRIIRRRPDRETRFAEGDRVEAIMEVDFRRSQIPEPNEGDTLYIGAVDESGEFRMTEEIVLTGDPLSDSEALTWTMGGETFDVSR